MFGAFNDPASVVFWLESIVTAVVGPEPVAKTIDPDVSALTLYAVFVVVPAEITVLIRSPVCCLTAM